MGNTVSKVNNKWESMCGDLLASIVSYMSKGYDAIELMRVHSKWRDELVRPNQAWAFDRIVFNMKEIPIVEFPVVIIITSKKELVITSSGLEKFPRLTHISASKSVIISFPLNNVIEKIDCKVLYNWTNLRYISYLNTSNIPDDEPLFDLPCLKGFSYNSDLLREVDEIMADTMQRFTNLESSSFSNLYFNEDDPIPSSEAMSFSNCLMAGMELIKVQHIEMHNCIFQDFRMFLFFLPRNMRSFCVIHDEVLIVHELDFNYLPIVDILEISYTNAEVKNLQFPERMSELIVTDVSAVEVNTAPNIIDNVDLACRNMEKLIPRAAKNLSITFEDDDDDISHLFPRQLKSLIVYKPKDFVLRNMPTDVGTIEIY